MRSVTLHIQQLTKGSVEAGEELFCRYLSRLTARAMAAARDFEGVRPVALDPEIAAQSALRSLIQRIRNGKERRALNRDDLWGLLLSKLKNKIIDQWRWEHAGKRGDANVRYAADVLMPSFSNGAGGDPLQAAAACEIAASEPTPEEVLQLKELYLQAMGVLPDDSCRHIARLELEGHTDVEISNLTGRALRTVQVRLCLIRATWKEELDRYAY
jgi:DNA-directed RNA polymerase specialized sigma24 family protein